MSLVLGGQTFLRSLVGWDSVKGDYNEDEDEAKSEDRINKNLSKQSNWILLEDDSESNSEIMPYKLSLVFFHLIHYFKIYQYCFWGN